MTDAEPANPVAERKPGEQAKTNNSVEAKDAFGAPRPDTEWTREAMESQMLTPGFNGSDDQVKKERAKDLKE
ncbi:hypothetical protein [Roseovarius pelagicus]|uniref:Uncharacterized protein n=1 Tax=Roseovarius pelagicus TaxID=2980108 RepID=A0ABY6DBM2_9RHOB|nr:hypothetical protein [Roseovarius pelagicus]UXX83536.1 hypothetical protein N7U68_02315 [Roseovarius pelagicus]